MKTTPKLIVSDIDGTLLTPQERVTPRLRDALHRAHSAGTKIVLATGRPHRWVHPVLQQLPGLNPVCISANGAVLFDSESGKIISRQQLQPAVLSTLVSAASDALSDIGPVGVAVERVGRSLNEPESELFRVSPEYHHTWEAQDYGVAELSELTSRPAVKLLLRSRELNSEKMYALIAPLIDESLGHVTYSMSEGLLEVSPPGVTKAQGLEKVAEFYEVPAEEVIAFGDMPNDIEMLQWAGYGVAMGNAVAQVKDIADYVTGTNEEDGLAEVLERWF